jgi:hypothetical protein
MGARVTKRSSTKPAKPKSPAAPAGKRPHGRPCLYNAEIAEQIIERMACGESLRSICREVGMPPEATVRGWAVHDVRGFSARYARARELQADAWVSQIFDIAGDVPADSNQIARAKLQIDSIKWVASKLLPQYGERLTTALTGADGGPIKTEPAIDYEALRSLSREEREILRGMLQRRAEAEKAAAEEAQRTGRQINGHASGRGSR